MIGRLRKAWRLLFGRPATGDVESRDIGLAIGHYLGLPTREVVNVKYEWLTKIPLLDGVLVDVAEHNYVQIVRTPARAEDKETALRVHLEKIRHLLEHGTRAKATDRWGDQTTTGGRRFFNSSDPGRVAYLRGRGLAWMTRPDGNGEWLSDIGWAP